MGQQNESFSIYIRFVVFMVGVICITTAAFLIGQDRQMKWEAEHRILPMVTVLSPSEQRVQELTAQARAEEARIARLLEEHADEVHKPTD